MAQVNRRILEWIYFLLILKANCANGFGWYCQTAAVAFVLYVYEYQPPDSSHHCTALMGIRHLCNTTGSPVAAERRLPHTNPQFLRDTKARRPLKTMRKFRHFKSTPTLMDTNILKQNQSPKDLRKHAKTSEAE